MYLFVCLSMLMISQKITSTALQEKKKLFFAQQKQSVPMRMNDFQMNILLCLIRFSIYAKIQPACKRMAENSFLKESQVTLGITCGPKILSKSLYVTLFPR